MLRSLTVRGFALLEDVQVEFEPGLNVVTGETGAGKSLLVNAIGFLLGERADATRVRSGATEASVEGIFEIPPGRARDEAFRVIEEKTGTRPEDDGIIALSRTLDASGRSRAFVCNRFLTRETLREIASYLLTVHGQKEHSTLARTQVQREKLDTFAGLDAVDGLRSKFAQKRTVAMAAWRELSELRRAERNRLDRLDLLRFQAGEIRGADIKNGELKKLKEDYQTLSNAERIRTRLSNHLESLHESESSALERISSARRAMQELAQLAPALAPLADRLEESRLQIDDVVSETRRFAESLDFDSARLAEITDRLDRVQRILDRFKVDEAGAIALQNEMESEIAKLSASGERGEALEVQLKSMLEELFVTGCKLTAARAAAAPKLSAAVLESLRGLEMEGAHFQVALRELERTPLSAADAVLADESLANLPPAMAEPDTLVKSNASGFDDIYFLIAPNPGEPAQPIGEIASGGELARVALAIESACAERVSTPIILFDEIDENVGGRLGPTLGVHLRKVAEPRQVLVVTHLAGVAACADHHLFVSKSVRDGRTQTQVESLEFDERIHEIAAMMTGDGASETAVAEARALIQSVNRKAFDEWTAMEAQGELKPRGKGKTGSKSKAAKAVRAKK